MVPTEPLCAVPFLLCWGVQHADPILRDEVKTLRGFPHSNLLLSPFSVLWTRYLRNTITEILLFWHRHSLGPKDELIPVSHYYKDAIFPPQKYQQNLPCLSRCDAETLDLVVGLSRIDSCNLLLSGLSCATRSPQLVQSAVARVLTKTKKFAHIAPVLALSLCTGYQCERELILRFFFST